MKKWFTKVNSIDELKKAYRKLAMKYHPDINIDGQEAMKEINNEYEAIFEHLLKNATQEEQKQYNKQGHNVNDGYREIINRIIHIPNITIEICGSWIWISGNTRPIKDQLKDAGFYWAAKKLQWYWRPEQYKAKRYKKSMTMDHIREKYGSEKINNRPYSQIQEAV